MIPCAVLGATGAVGQRFIEALHGHPDFELASLVASDRTAGKRYGDAANWILDDAMPASVQDVRVEDMAALRARDDVRLVFSALPSAQAGEVERLLAAKGKRVFTNASTHRMDPDVPLLIPEVNPDHLALAEAQAGDGMLVANGNCSGIILTLALAPLHRAFGLDTVHVTTMQGLSGAGYPGVSALDVVDNVLPYIGGEEEKLEIEPQKTLGTLDHAADFEVHATCTRVPVREGHFEAVHAKLRSTADAAAVRAAFESFRGPDEVAALPSAPARPIIVHDAPDRPQPRRDRDAGAGMAVNVGRIQVRGDTVRFVVLGHNTVRGAAGQSVLNAEYAATKGLL